MYRQLNSDKIIDTISTLQHRIRERFPESGLTQVCGEILLVAKDSQKRCIKISQANVPLRLGILFILILVIFVFIFSLKSLKLSFNSNSVESVLQVLEAGMNTFVLVGGATFFLITSENRLKQRRALKALNELRSLAHVVDMHQLPKDPDRVLYKGRETASSPKKSMTPFEYSRYLNYCSEMLSLLGKIAAIYGESLKDAVISDAVNDIETLTTGLSRKIWQKIMIFHQLESRYLAEGSLKNASLLPSDKGV